MARHFLGDGDLPPDAVFFSDRASWRNWLAEHAETETGIWAVTLKKTASLEAPSYDDMVEEALCFGWVDSRPRSLDEQHKMLWFAPRKPKSGWSRLNKERVERLTAAGLMAAPGLRKVEASIADGSWTKLDMVEELTVPDDLQAHFDLHPGSRANFEAFPRSVKRSILEWIVQAKKPETRAARVEETARLAAENVRANQWRTKG